MKKKGKYQCLKKIPNAQSRMLQLGASWLENQLAVLMKSLPLGQQAAQRLTSDLLPTLQQAQQLASQHPTEHWGSAAFGLALASMAHERQYSRLFRS